MTTIPPSPRYGTPEWDKAVSEARAMIERVMSNKNAGMGRTTYGRGSFEGVL
jgi:hypothetical protein